MQGTLHSICAWVLIIALAESCFALALQFARVPHWRGWAGYSGLTGVLILVFLGASVQGSTSGHIAGLAPVDGLFDRLAAGSGALWIFLITATLVVQERIRRR